MNRDDITIKLLDELRKKSSPAIKAIKAVKAAGEALEDHIALAVSEYERKYNLRVTSVALINAEQLLVNINAVVQEIVITKLIIICEACGAEIVDGQDMHFDENNYPVHDHCEHDGCY